MSYRVVRRWMRLGVVMATVLLCWSAQAQNYDHFQHGFDLDGAHMLVSCESCHKAGVFQGTPTECAICHDGSVYYAETSLSSAHMPVSGFCESCHITADWTSIIEVNHSDVVGECLDCHNSSQVFASGLPAGHLATSQSCDACHSTFAWNTTVFNHEEVLPGTCATCHDGR